MLSVNLRPFRDRPLVSRTDRLQRAASEPDMSADLGNRRRPIITVIIAATSVTFDLPNIARKYEW